MTSALFLGASSRTPLSLLHRTACVWRWAATSALLLAPMAPATAQGLSDREAVNQVMQQFVRAFETSDTELVRSLTRADGTLVGYSPDRGQVLTRSIEAWTKGWTGKPDADEAQRKRSYQILDVTETGAVSKMVFDYPGWDGIDYISLAKIDGKWLIISKSWNWKKKPEAKN